MAQKKYRAKIDLRVLSEKLKFLVYISSENEDKKLCMDITYDTNYPVESVYTVDDNGAERFFLVFKNSHLKFKTYVSAISVRRSDLILEVFKNVTGNFGFNKLGGGRYGAFLSSPQYFNVGGRGPLGMLNSMVGHKMHAIQMVLSDSVLMNRKSRVMPSFDIDILSEKCNQYTHNLSFKPTAEDVKVEGDTLDIKPVKQIINETKNVNLKTTYIKLKQKDLASREVIFDYNKELKHQNYNWENLTLIDSRVYAIENDLNVDTDLSELNLPNTNTIQIPYNISREYYNDKVVPSNKIIKNGKEIYPLNWVKELQNNEIIQEANKCISLKFTSREQIISFAESLTKQQIGNIETYPTLVGFEDTVRTKRIYSKISQWVERTTLDIFTDVRFTYDSDGYIVSILICPAKNSQVGPEKISTQENLYTAGGEYILPGGENYIGFYHVHDTKGPMVGAQHVDTSHESLIPLYTYAPISGFSSTDFCFTTYDTNNKIGTYSAFTYSIKRNDTLVPTYDLHLSGSSFSGKTIIPISNIESSKKLPLTGDDSKMYRAYTFPQAYSENGGYVNITTSSPTSYMEYTAKTSGVYRFTYNSHLNVSYTDTKWCDYLKVNYPSGATGNYPSSDYDVKRLINTSIIQEGEGETETVLVDTNLKFHPGLRYCGTGAERKFCRKEFTNTGIGKFKFESYISKLSTGGTETILAKYSVGRSKNDGGCNEYLTLNVTDLDKYSSGFTSCVLNTTSASTIFSKSIPVKVDTGLITLAKGDKVVLKYNTDWESTSKRSGVSNIDINLGHKLSGDSIPVEAPYYRGVKLSSITNIVEKNLFFDASRHSLPFKMVQGTTPFTVKLDGVLYISDSECGNLTTPVVNRDTFSQLKFVDTTAPQNRLVWDIQQTTPTNEWQYFIENNTIKDYTLEIGDKKSLTHLKDNGAFCFYIPTYNDEYGATCNYTFPSISQSYVIHNKFKNTVGTDAEHFIVVTPECKFYKPCTANKPGTIYDILHKSLPEKRKLLNYKRKLTINGKEITIISNKSHSNPEPTKLPSQNVCRYYCSCGQAFTSALDTIPSSIGGDIIPIDSIFGTTNIITDLTVGNCEECLEVATNYCSSLMANIPSYFGNFTNLCQPFIVGDCELTNPSPEQIDLVRKKGERIIVTVTENNEIVESGPGGPGPVAPSGKGNDGTGSDVSPCPEGQYFNEETRECEDLVREPRGPSGRPSNPGGPVRGKGEPDDPIRPPRPRGPVNPTEPRVSGYYCEGASYGCQYTTNPALIVFVSLDECTAFCGRSGDVSITGVEEKPKEPTNYGDNPVKSVDEILGVSEKELEEIKEKEPEKYDELVKEATSSNAIDKYDSDASEKSLCKDGFYWCESAGKCISIKEACK